MTTTDQDGPTVARDAVRLGDCPPGLFRFGDTIGFKTEYRGMETIGPVEVTGSEIRWVVGRHSEVYIVESGEAFWGGVRTKDAREDLIVTPISLASVSSASAEPSLLRQAAEKARAQFQFYADEHGKAEKYEKARTNAGFAEMLEEALAASSEPVPATNQAGEVDRPLGPHSVMVEGEDENSFMPVYALAGNQVYIKQGDAQVTMTRAMWRDLLAAFATTPTPPTLSEDLREAFQTFFDEVEANECTHDNTHRGGAIWTICSDCG